MTCTLPNWLSDLLASPPRAGEGVNVWLYCMARHLHVHMTGPEIVALLLECVAHCGRQVTRAEVERAVANSLTHAWQPRNQRFSVQPVQSASRWPTVNKEQREAIISAGGGLADLWELSSVLLGDNKQHTEEIIDRLFPPNALLCCGRSQSEFDTKTREEWRGELARLQFIVPSPMVSITGQTKDGRQSKHTLANTGPRRFLICEFDTGTTDEHAALLVHLAGYAPLVCAVHSGGKSLHGWFFIAGQAEEKVFKFFQYAVWLGADRATWTRSQFVRMPDGTRDNGNRQTVFFLNFKSLEAAR
jgi:hypothetical protein